MTKKEAKKIIEKFGENTGYFTSDANWKVSIDDFKNMLQFRMGFGLAESEVITASLVLAGAFKK